MENEIMNNIGEAMEENMDLMTETYTSNGTGKGVLIGAGLVAGGIALYKLGKKAWHKFKAKKGTVKIPDDIAEDEIDEIPE